MRCGNAQDQFRLLQEYFLRQDQLLRVKIDAEKLAA